MARDAPISSRCPGCTGEYLRQSALDLELDARLSTADWRSLLLSAVAFNSDPFLPVTTKGMEIKSNAVISAGSPNPAVSVIPPGCALGAPKFPARSSKILLAYKSATQHLNATGFRVTTISKAGMGIVKLATTQLKHQDKKVRVGRTSGAGNRRPSVDSSTSKRSPLDQLAALMLHGQARFRQLSQESPCDTKPQNCRRVVVLGAPRVGKTSILRRFLRDGFEEQYEPTSEDFHRKLYHIRGETYQIEILDASGERDFPAKRRLSILTGDIFLLVFSLDDRSSFEEVCALWSEITTAKSALLKSKGKANVPTVVCANKVDLPTEQHAVSRMEVHSAFADGCAFFETSAKDSVNLEQVFEALAKRGGLPLETGPSQHRKVSIRSYQALRAARQVGRGGKADIACGVLYPLARRPSFSTDLRLVLASQSNRKPSKPNKKCKIQ